MTMTPSKPCSVHHPRSSAAGCGQIVGFQLDGSRQVATQRGWAVVNEYGDAGVSGTRTSRTGMVGRLALTAHRACLSLRVAGMDQLADALRRGRITVPGRVAG